jgi:hypothetical protein
VLDKNNRPSSRVGKTQRNRSTHRLCSFPKQGTPCVLPLANPRFPPRTGLAPRSRALPVRSNPPIPRPRVSDRWSVGKQPSRTESTRFLLMGPPRLIAEWGLGARPGGVSTAASRHAREQYRGEEGKSHAGTVPRRAGTVLREGLATASR